MSKHLRLYQPNHRWARKWSSIGIATIFVAILVIWLIFKPYQSHFLSALRVLGDTTTTNYIGIPKEGRGDEWSTYLPLLKQAALEGFPEKSEIAPYKERFNWFIAIPKADASLFFLPNHASYFVLPNGLALSFQAIYYNLLLIFSLVWLLCNFQVDKGIALFAAFLLVFSQFYQVWWTSNFPALAASILPFAILTSNLKSRWKFIASLWAVGHLLFGQIYPPFYISLFIGFTPLLIFIKPQAFNARSVFGVGVGALIALFLFFQFKHEYIQLVSHTEYPGRRFELGGGSTWQAILNLIFPTWFIQNSGGAEPVYELSVAGTILPVILISMLPVVQWNRKTIFVTIGFLIIFAFSINYAIYAVPAWVSKYSGLSMVPGRRMHLGVSVAVFVYCAWMISENKDNFSLKRLLPVLIVPIFAISRTPEYMEVAKEFRFSIYYYGFALFLIAMIGALSWERIGWIEGNNSKLVAFLGGMAVVHVIIFGSFNPILNANSIMRPVESQLVKDWKALYQVNDKRPFAIPGNFGHLLRGEGLPALEAIHMVNVDSSVYDSIFEEISEEQRKSLFNRFLGIAFDNIKNPDLNRGLTKVFPMHIHGVSLKHEFSLGAMKDVGSLENISVKISETSKSGIWDVFFTGFMRREVNLSAPLEFVLTCSVDGSWVSRFPISGVEEALDRISLRGVIGVIQVNHPDKDSVERCINAIQLAKK